jgi:hypothetical protein
MNRPFVFALTLVVGLIMVTPVSPALATPGCDSAAYALAGWRVTGTFEWYYNPAGQPVNGLAAAKQAVADAFAGKNACGLPGVSPRQVYKGTTSARPAVPSDSECGSRDRKNVIGWGQLNSVARTCTWRRGTRMVESDVLLSTSRKWFVGNVPAGCAVLFDVQSVLVHEAGHMLGLAHVTDGSQVMAAKTLPCSIWKRQLRAGDMNGLQRLY